MLVRHTICLCLWHWGVAPYLLAWISFRRTQITSRPARRERTWASRAGRTLWSLCPVLMDIKVLRPLWRIPPFQRQHGSSGMHWDRVFWGKVPFTLAYTRIFCWNLVKCVLSTTFTGQASKRVPRKLHDHICQNIANYYFNRSTLSFQAVPNTRWVLLPYFTTEAEIMPTTVWNGLAMHLSPLTEVLRQNSATGKLTCWRTLKKYQFIYLFIGNILVSALQLLQFMELICLWNIFFLTFFKLLSQMSSLIQHTV